MHARQQIRDAVATALTGLSATGSNVFKTRVHKLEQETLPALLVYTLQEDAERETIGARKQQRALRVGVEIAVQQVSGIDAELDDIAVEVENALETAWQAASGIWASIRDLQLNSSVISMSGEGEQRALGMVLTYTVLYRTAEGVPETIIT
jgi:hypothetical protein